MLILPRRGAFRGIRRALAAVLLAGAAVPTAVRAQQQPAAIPNSPVGSRLADFFALMAQSDTASIRAFVAQAMGADFQAMPIAEHVEAIVSMRADLRGARLVSQNSDPYEMEAWLDAGGRRFVLQMAVEPDPPHRIRGLGVNPERPTQAAPATLSAGQRAEVVEAVSAQVERNYVSADTGAAIARHLRARLAAGGYDSITRPAALAQALTADLRSINGDRHLFVQAPAVQDAPADPDAAARESSGVQRVERLEGNVGYVRFSLLSGAGAAQAVQNALELLATTDAVILDVRGVPGGSTSISNLLISHFAAPGVPSLRVTGRAGDVTETRATLAQVPGPRRLDVPLYVLIDRGTASAAEDLPFVLQSLGRAIIVGSRSMGAGRNGRSFDAGHGMVVSVSVSRVADPRTGRGWEAVGVTPDLPAEPAQALAAAHQDALRKLAAAATHEGRRMELSLAADYVAAQAAAASPARPLQAYAGRYDEGRIVSVHGGRLFYQPGELASPVPLTSLGEDGFAISPTARLRFVGEGSAMRMEVGDGPRAQPRTFARIP